MTAQLTLEHTALHQLEERFRTKVKVTANGCWEWMASLNTNGYGFYSLNGKAVMAHRYAYEILVGPIPDGLQLDHLCRIRNCVNPRHCEAVTQRINTLRGEGVTAKAARQTHCVHGHPLTEDNIYRRPSKPRERDCMTCKRIEWDRSNQKRKKRGRGDAR